MCQIIFKLTQQFLIRRRFKALYIDIVTKLARPLVAMLLNHFGRVIKVPFRQNNFQIAESFLTRIFLIIFLLVAMAIRILHRIEFLNSFERIPSNDNSCVKFGKIRLSGLGGDIV